MATTNTSRFALLKDDAPDPFEKKPKAKKDKPVTAAKKKKSGKKSDVKDNPQPKQQLEGKKQKPEQLNEWLKRDEEFVSTIYRTELEEALFQSELSFQEQNNKEKKTKKKRAVPLLEFQQRLEENDQNGSDLELEQTRLQTIRAKSKAEVDRQEQLQLERELILRRGPPAVVNSTPNPVPAIFEEELKEKDAEILQLKKLNENLEKEVDVIKAKFKKVCSVLGDAELKEKTHLLIEMEKLNKLNTDLNVEVMSLHTMLEQEKSKFHASLLELKKLKEEKQRTGGRNNSESAQ